MGARQRAAYRGLMPDEVAICNLLYRYAELMDRGRFEDLEDELFARAHFIVAPPPAAPLTGRQMVQLICQTTIRYGDGTPRTKHVITNPIVEVDQDRATCRSYYTVYQQTETLPLQIVVSGRYHDRFTKIEGRWWFSERDYTLVDMTGDLSQHIRFDLKPAQ